MVGLPQRPKQEEQGFSMPAKVRSFDVDFQLETALNFGTSDKTTRQLDQLETSPKPTRSPHKAVDCTAGIYGYLLPKLQSTGEHSKLVESANATTVARRSK